MGAATRSNSDHQQYLGMMVFSCFLLAGTVLGQDTGAIKAAPPHSNNGWSWTFSIWTNGRFGSI
jgi:hypothetical protein